MEIKYLFIFPKVAVERPNGMPPFPPLPASPGLAPHQEMASRQCVLLVGFSLAGDASSISCQDRVLCTERDNVTAQFASCREEACSAPGCKGIDSLVIHKLRTFDIFFPLSFPFAHNYFPLCPPSSSRAVPSSLHLPVPSSYEGPVCQQDGKVPASQLRQSGECTVIQSWCLELRGSSERCSRSCSLTFPLALPDCPVWPYNLAGSESSNSGQPRSLVGFSCMPGCSDRVGGGDNENLHLPVSDNP